MLVHLSEAKEDCIHCYIQDTDNVTKDFYFKYIIHIYHGLHIWLWGARIVLETPWQLQFNDRSACNWVINRTMFDNNYIVFYAMQFSTGPFDFRW